MLRYNKNPIITPAQVKPSRPDFEVIGAFNASAIKMNEEIILLIRVAERPVPDQDKYRVPLFDVKSEQITFLEFDKNDEDCDFSDSRWIRTKEKSYITSISHLRVARSKDGLNFEIEETPAMAAANQYETYGIEDPRTVRIDGRYYITYSAISDIGITDCLAVTEDFKTFQRLGLIFHPDNKDVVIFPEKIEGKYYALHRPSTSVFGKPDIWIAESPDLLCWGNHRHLMGTREGYWDSGRVGASATPFKVAGGWLEIYHGATKDDRYCLGALLHHETRPWEIIARSKAPILEPKEIYETEGFLGGVVFTCGVIRDEEDIHIYYGAADTSICYAKSSLEEIMSSLEYYEK